MEQVKWKFDYYKNIDAQKCYEELGDTNITANEIVEKAKDPNSELHKAFTWDDSKAAKLWRLEEARHLVANLVFVPKSEDETPVRVFHISTEKSVYKPTKLILKQPDEYQALLERAKLELYAFQRKYKSLAELEDVFTAINEL